MKEIQFFRPFFKTDCLLKSAKVRGRVKGTLGFGISQETAVVGVGS
jgi:hypothetical protein